ncbi:hypothetical protein B5K11_30395 [Rhizobium leguminosarum bv. trifolii]|nr:hypothetical protein B5K11_30395 [Rhizobium leguminosarum bv. trifolii]
MRNTANGVRGQGIVIPDELLSQVAPLPWAYIAPIGDYLRPIRANRFNPNNFNSLSGLIVEMPTEPRPHLPLGTIARPRLIAPYGNRRCETLSLGKQGDIQ